MKVLRSALKHGCAPEAILHAVSTARERRRLAEDPDAWLYLGAGDVGRMLEIVTIQGDDEEEVVIHAMKMRRRYVPRAGRP